MTSKMRLKFCLVKIQHKIIKYEINFACFLSRILKYIKYTFLPKKPQTLARRKKHDSRMTYVIIVFMMIMINYYDDHDHDVRL